MLFLLSLYLSCRLHYIQRLTINPKDILLVMTFILVTGGAGFIGSNFIRYALKSRPDWHIVNLDALTYAGNPMNLAGLEADQADRYTFIHGDIRNRKLLSLLFKKHPFSGVFHFAAETHVDRSISSPHTFIETNINGTFLLLQESLAHVQSKPTGDFRFLHVSTDEVYGSLDKTGYFSEQTPYDPSSPYSASKAASDHVAKSYHRTYGLPVLVTNCSNNYGPYQFPEKLIPLMILNILKERPLPVYGDGRNIRDWLYVLDHCEALLQVFDKGKPGESYNIGGNSESTNINVVHLLCKIMDKRLKRKGKRQSSRLITFVEDRPGHDLRYAIDATKIKRETGWSPAHNFLTALEKTVEWYIEHMDWVASVESGDYLNWIKTHYASKGL